MTQLSDSDALKLLKDRVEFKLYAAEQELNGLKEYESSGSKMSLSPVTRVTWEMKIECLLAHLVGSVDALLVLINDKLGMGMNIKDVNSSPNGISVIKRHLKTKSNLLTPLEIALDCGDNTKVPPHPPGWLWTLKDLRNQGMHREIIKLQTHASLVEYNTGAKHPFAINKVYLITNPQTNLEIIPYLEDSLKKIRALMGTIIANEPLLKM